MSSGGRLLLLLLLAAVHATSAGHVHRFGAVRPPPVRGRWTYAVVGRGRIAFARAMAALSGAARLPSVRGEQRVIDGAEVVRTAGT